MNAPQRLPVQSPVTYNDEKAADICGIPVDELRELRHLGTGPEFVFCPASGKHLYTPESLNAWLCALHGGGAA